MNPPKIVWAAIAFALVIGSSALLLSQFSNYFSSAQNPTITGTVVLKDNDTITPVFMSTLSLPGSTCSVKIVRCGENNIQPIDDSPALFSFTGQSGGNFTQLSPSAKIVGLNTGTTYRNCQATAYDSVAGGNYLILSQLCTNKTGNNLILDCVSSNSTQYKYLAASYSCS